jgi:hypothetical protein
MSGSHRGPAATDARAESDSDAPLRRFYRYVVTRSPILPAVERDMRTLVSVPGAALWPEDTDRERILERAVTVLRQIEEGQRELIEGRTETALGVGRATNHSTGQCALIVRRLLPGGRYSGPLAELLTTNGELDEASKEGFGWLKAAAAQSRLEIRVYEQADEEHPRLAAFAILRRPDEEFWYLARLLVTPHEIGQWREPFLEVETGSIN